MNTNGPKSSQDPSNPNKPHARDPAQQPARPNQPARSTDPSYYSPGPKSTEPGRMRSPTSDELGKTYTGESTRSSSDYTHKDKDYYQKEKVEDKVRDTFRSLKDSRQVDDMYNYAKLNKEQTATYVVLAIGIIMLFFDVILGGLVVGAVAGYHFAPEIIYYVRNIGQIFSGPDRVRYVVLAGLLVALFITTPGIFIGAAIVAAFKQIFQTKNDSSDRPNHSDQNDYNSNHPKNRP